MSSEVVFEATYVLDDYPEPPFDSDVIQRMLQDQLGFSGIVVTAVFVADGASDL